jgi:hypothetical protein
MEEHGQKVLGKYLDLTGIKYYRRQFIIYSRKQVVVVVHGLKLAPDKSKCTKNSFAHCSSSKMSQIFI